MATPLWTAEEFEILLANSSLRDEHLVGLLPNRSVGAIGVVRAFIHNYHQGGSTSGVSQMMLDRLASGSYVCSVCGEVSIR